MCVKNPPAGSKKCKKLKTNGNGKDYALVLRWFNNPLGTYKFVWKKGGHKIDKDISMSLHL